MSDFPPEEHLSIPAVPISALPEDEERLKATLEVRIYNLIGKELLNKEFKPTSYAMAVVRAEGNPDLINYFYTLIRYNDLMERATRRLQHNKEYKE